MSEKKHEKEVKIAREDFPGAAIDAADENRVEKDAVRNDVRSLNDNPRNTDFKMP